MQQKNAVARAKAALLELFGDETLRDLGLEEIRFDDADGSWLITLGFSRAWDAPKKIETALGRELDLNRTYKMVRISDETGAIVSIMDRMLAFEAAGS